MSDGIKQIPIEERSPEEISLVEGIYNNMPVNVDTTPKPNVRYSNYAFDVTPAKFITAFITEKGIIKADEIKSKLFCFKHLNSTANADSNVLQYLDANANVNV